MTPPEGNTGRQTLLKTLNHSTMLIQKPKDGSSHQMRSISRVFGKMSLTYTVELVVSSAEEDSISEQLL